VVNFVLIVFVLLAWPIRPVESVPSYEAPIPSHPTLRLAATALALGLAGCAIVWQATARQALRAEKEASARLLAKFLGDMEFVAGLHFKQEPRSISCRDDDFIVRAEPGERKRLVLFTDLQCSACILFTNELLKKHVSKFDGHLDVALKHFPLCKDCNEHVDKEVHPHSCEAAYLAEAVRMQGGVKALLQTMDFISLERPEPFTTEDIATVASLAKPPLDAEQLERDRHSEAARTRVEEDVQLGASLDVPGTPTAFLDGRIIDPIAGRVDGFWEALAQFQE
jgi:protein-disulfide isomerase